jgi:hypothetical protein
MNPEKNVSGPIPAPPDLGLHPNCWPVPSQCEACRRFALDAHCPLRIPAQIELFSEILFNLSKKQ